MDIWAACREASVPGPLVGELVRIVESQEKIATNAIVESLEEQSLLEELLEGSKPARHPAAAGLHYLLSTPFRYPPLRYGSRFGTRYEPSLFYGARDLKPALAETAYYRLVFWSGMKTPPPFGKLTTEHTAFGARYAVETGLRLQKPPFQAYHERLSDPADYSHTQGLGSSMREAGIKAFEYVSARDPENGINIALFHPGAFSCPGPLWQEPWLCETTSESVTFYNKAYGTQHYLLEVFLVEGRLPSPAVQA